MNQDEINEVHLMLVHWFLKNKKSSTDVISFLTSTWVGQMRLNGYSEAFVDSTLQEMKKDWKNHRLSREIT